MSIRLQFAVVRRPGKKNWSVFLENRLSAYEEKRNHPDDYATSGLSPYLHFGHISVHQIFYELMSREGWMPEKPAWQGHGQQIRLVGRKPTGRGFSGPVGYLA